MIHQMVHGYQHGHQLLTGSTRLASTHDQDLMLTLTDLSGIIPESTEFKPYITAYPLPSSSYYVLAKTWLDENAERSGCVLTHSLLIDLNMWHNIDHPYVFSNLFCLPSVPNLDRFSRPLDFSDRSIRPAPSISNVTADFCNLYFKEALVPVVWFDAHDPDQLFWNIISGIWPSLRDRFACCTFALDQRRLDERPFDLLFVPKSSYARFKRYAKKHFIQAGSQRLKEDDSWLDTWNAYLFQHTKLPEHVEALMPFLGASQTELQKVFAFDSAIRAADGTPMLLLGAMDILESLAPQPDQAVTLKNSIVARAVRSSQGDSATHLEFLKLLISRLGRAGYANVDRNSIKEASQDVLQASSAAIQDALFLFQVDDYFAGHGFEKAVVAALEKQARKHPEVVMTLFDFPQEAASILPSSPPVAAAIANELSKHPDPRQMHQFVEWLFYSNCTDFGELIRLLVPSLTLTADIEFLQLLLERASQADLPILVDLLQDCVVTSPLPVIFAQTVSSRFPDEVRTHITKPETPSLALALAATYPKDRSGLDELLGFQSSAMVLTQFLTKCLDRGHFPLWVREAMQSDNRIFELLISASLAGQDDATDHLLDIVCSDIDALPIAQSKIVVSKIDQLKPKPFYRAIRQSAGQNAVAQFLAGDISFPQYRDIIQHSWMQEYMNSDDVRSLIPLVRTTCRRDSAAWKRAWEWLSKSTSFYSKDSSLVPMFVDCLLTLPTARDVGQVVDQWERILNHSYAEASNEVVVNTFTQCLLFCVESRERHLSPLVVRAFWEVHSAAMKGDLERAAWAASVLRIMGWDKAAHIRDRLIEAFRKSDWPPGDFALASREPQLLRKLCQRMRNNWTKTDRYLRDALRDLEQRPDVPQNSPLVLELRSVIRHPEKKDEWF